MTSILCQIPSLTPPLFVHLSLFHASNFLMSTQPSKIVLPDLVSHCTFTLRLSRHRKQITSETKKWLFKDGNLLGRKKDAYHGLKCGTLTAMTYPMAGCPQLRVCNDFLTYLFHLDNLSDDMDNLGTLSTADEVLNSLYHPHTYQSTARVGKMTREYVDNFSTSCCTLTDLSALKLL